MAKEIKDDLGTIIVNGVDVSDCCYIQEGAECEAYQTECEAQVCYYQQLKRKEQEYKYWKHQAELGSDTVNIMAKEIENLKAENEELKEDNYNLNMSLYQYFQTDKQNQVYKQALDIIEQYCIDTLELQDVHTIKQDILKYIKKAKGEE